jgi:hypothetical protein
MLSDFVDSPAVQATLHRETNEVYPPGVVIVPGMGLCTALFGSLGPDLHKVVSKPTEGPAIIEFGSGKLHLAILDPRIAILLVLQYWNLNIADIAI